MFRSFYLIVIVAACLNTVFGGLKELLDLGKAVNVDAEILKDWERTIIAKNINLPDVEFNCEIEVSQTKPTSVHRLRPSDIDVIGALGDSLTAGNGLAASNILQVAIEYRGEAFSIGGYQTLDDDTLTLTNVLKKFNPDIKGFPECPSTRDNEERSWLNVAHPPAVNHDMAYQAQLLIERIRRDDVISLHDDWKLITLFVGANDLCSSCEDWERFSPETYGREVRRAVDVLFNELPRVFVNIVAMFDVSFFEEMSQTLVCRTLQTFSCECAVNQPDSLRATQLQYYEELLKISQDDVYTYREDFAVVLQPFLRDFEPPRDTETGELMMDFFAPDCFHPNRLGHQSFAFSLWNSMLTPVGSKPVTSEVNLGPEPNILRCPSQEHPYIFTNTNSR